MKGGGSAAAAEGKNRGKGGKDLWTRYIPSGIGTKTFGYDAERYWPTEHSTRRRREQQADDAYADDFLNGGLQNEEWTGDGAEVLRS